MQWFIFSFLLNSTSIDVNRKIVFRFLLGKGAEWKAALLLAQKCGIWRFYAFFVSSMPVGIKLRILYCDDGCSWCASHITVVHFHVLEVLNFFIYEKVVGFLVFVYFHECTVIGEMVGKRLHFFPWLCLSLISVVTASQTLVNLWWVLFHIEA